MLDSAEFALLVAIGAFVIGLIWSLKSPPEDVTTEVMFGIILAVGIGLFFLLQGMEALDENKISCGRRMHRRICGGDEFSFWATLLPVHYLGSACSFSFVFKTVFTSFLSGRSSRRDGS